jgi:hypothetical protein
MSALVLSLEWTVIVLSCFVLLVQGRTVIFVLIFREALGYVSVFFFGSCLGFCLQLIIIGSSGGSIINCQFELSLQGCFTANPCFPLVFLFGKGG